MKIKYFLLVLLLCFTVTNMSSQEIDILGAIQENADLYNESRGIEDDESNTQPTEEQQQQAQEYWEEAIGDSMDFINGIDKPNHQCLALIGLFSYQMIAMQKAIDEEVNCKMKYDLMGMQLLILISGTTIMPCTEGLYNLSDPEKEELMKGFLSSLYEYRAGSNPGDENPLEGEGFPSYLRLTDLAKKAEGAAKQIYIGYFEPKPPPPAGNTDWPFDPEYLEYNLDLDAVLEMYFEPRNLVYNIAEIGMKMEALGCGG